MYAVATFLVVAVITLTFTRLATGALIATGMPANVAAFQARSAFSGAGFTTTEAENVVNHPVRRKIIATTMFVGSLGTPTLVVSVMIGFIGPGPGSSTERTLVGLSGLLFIILVATNRPMTRIIETIGQRYARGRLLPSLGSTVEELTLGDEFVVASVRMEETPPDSIRSLIALSNALPEIRVLGIRRGDSYRGAPPVDIHLERGDELVVYGSRAAIGVLTASTSPLAG